MGSQKKVAKKATKTKKATTAKKTLKASAKKTVVKAKKPTASGAVVRLQSSDTVNTATVAG